MNAGPAPRRALILSVALSTTAALGAVSAGPSRADTGGSRLVYVVQTGTGAAGYRATADHPKVKTRLSLPQVPHGADTPVVDNVVLSPDGTRIAEAFHFSTGTDTSLAIDVADSHGNKQHRVWTRAATGDNLVAGMAWSADGKHLYFGSAIANYATKTFTSRLLTARVRPASVGAVGNLPGGSGLSWPTADPTSSVVAAVRDGIGCRFSNPGGGSPVTATIVLLHPGTGHRSDLTSVTAPKAGCAEPVTKLAWSPNGGRIAFARYAYGADFRATGDVMVVNPAKTDPVPQMAISGQGKHIALAPAWQSAHSLWCQWIAVFDDAHSTYTKPDLMSAKYANGSFKAPVNQTGSRSIAELAPSFG
jgi:Tol biopolymer transport system component